MLHILGWVAVGVTIGVIAWLLRPMPRRMRLAMMLLLSVTGALFGGFVSWFFWDFPGTVTDPHEFWNMPALVSDCMAAFAALVVLSLAAGAVIRGTMNSGSSQ